MISRRDLVLGGAFAPLAGGAARGADISEVDRFEDLFNFRPPVGAAQVRTRRHGIIKDGGASYRIEAHALPRTAYSGTFADGRGFILAMTELSPEMFGAASDGTTDDYPALHALAEFVSGKTGLRIRFARKTYLIARHKVDGPRSNGVTDIIWRHTEGLVIDLNGAKIDVFGRFFRPLDLKVFPYSTVNSVEVFVFEGGRRLALYNGEIDGNVDQMTRETGNGEGKGYGVEIRGVDGYRLEDLYIHHWATDGIYLTGYDDGTGGSVVSTVGVFKNLRCHFNARQGLSIAGANGLVVEACSFAYTGYVSIAADGTGVSGSYGFHAPGAGVDIEPEIARPNLVTGGLLFRNCIFEENHGWPTVADHALQAQAGGITPVSDVTYDGCTFRMRKQRGALWFFIRKFDVRNCRFENVGLWPCYGAHKVDEGDMSGEITGNTFLSTIKDASLLSGGATGNKGSPHLHIHDNMYIIRPGQSYSVGARAIGLDLWPNVQFENNVIDISDNAFTYPFSTIFPHPFAAALGIGDVHGNRWISKGRKLTGIATRRTTRISEEVAEGLFGYTLIETGQLDPIQPFNKGKPGHSS